MKIDITTDELAELVAKVIQVTREEGFITPFAARTVALEKFPNQDDESEEQIDMLVELLIQGVGMISQHKPQITEMAESGRTPKSPPRSSFVSRSPFRRDPHEVASEISSSSFEPFSIFRR